MKTNLKDYALIVIPLALVAGILSASRLLPTTEPAPVITVREFAEVRDQLGPLGLRVQEPRKRWLFLVDRERPDSEFFALVRSSKMADHWQGIVQVISISPEDVRETEDDAGFSYQHGNLLFWGDPELIRQIKDRLAQ
jgi:hypothetical protein